MDKKDGKDKMNNMDKMDKMDKMNKMANMANMDIMDSNYKYRYIEVMDKIIQYGQLWTKYGKINNIEKSSKNRTKWT